MPESAPTSRVKFDSRGVATLTLTRSDRHNAMNPELIKELAAAAERLGRNEAVRVVVLAAEGRSFCAGRWHMLRHIYLPAMREPILTGVRLGFVDFARSGVPMTLASVAAAVVWLWATGLVPF